MCKQIFPLLKTENKEGTVRMYFVIQEKKNFKTKRLPLENTDKELLRRKWLAWSFFVI